jgi:hypothetical protein
LATAGGVAKKADWVSGLTGVDHKAAVTRAVATVIFPQSCQGVDASNEVVDAVVRIVGWRGANAAVEAVSASHPRTAAEVSFMFGV